MNLFAAVPVAAFPGAAAVTLGQLRDEAPRARWTRPAAWHITLKYIGPLPPPREELVLAQLRRVRGRRFRYTLAGLGVFPEARRPRVLWAGVGAGEDSWRALAGAIEAALGEIGIAREEREYHPHLTLARGREPADLLPLRARIARDQPPWGEQEALEFCLFRTRTGDALHSYEVRERFALDA